MQFEDWRAPLTRLLQILGLFYSMVLNPGRRITDPTALLPRDFKTPLSIREGKDVLLGRSDINIPSDPRRLPRVSLDLGEIEGYFMRVISGRTIYAFEGIPYAEPPLGELRFRAPLPKKAWKPEIVRAQAWPPMCVQTRARRPGIHGQEDCLYLNVYTPHLPPEGGESRRELLPMVIFIHGGAYVVGSAAEYGPSYLMQQDIVLVTINYRLGVFGFLSTGSATCSGNWGLKDQALAIEWAHKYAEHFGGDREKFVLMGQSAGAVSVHLQMMSPFIRDKITAAISLSGTAFMTWALRRSNEERQLARRLAAINLCNSNVGDEALLTCLRSRTTANITVASTFLMVAERKVFMPVIEVDLPGSFITKTPTEYYKSGEVAAVPFITTITSQELEITLAVKLARIELLPQFQYFGPPIVVAFSPVLLDFQDKVRNVEEVTKKIFNYYGGEDNIRKDSRVLAQIASDRHFAMGLRRALKHHLRIAPTYTYFFSYKSDLGYADELRLDPHQFGVPHGEDLVFLFNRTERKPIGRTQGHFAIVKLLQTFFYNFAAKGEPLYTDEEFRDYKIWPKLDSDDPVNFLQVDHEVKMMTLPEFQNATDFWNSLGIRDL